MMVFWRDAKFRNRTLFIFGNAAICFVVVVCIISPLQKIFIDRDNQILDQRNLLARLTAIAAQAENVRSIAADAGVQLQGREFLAGPNENVINADLQTRLKAITDAAGTRSRAVQSLPLKTSDQVKYSGSRIEIFGSLQSIHRAIYAIESSEPYLFIVGAVIKSLPASRQGGVEEPVIQAQLDVFGAIKINGREP